MGLLRERTSVGLDAHDLLDIAVIGVATFVMAVAVLSWAFPLDGAAETSKARTVKRQRGVRRDQASQGRVWLKVVRVRWRCGSKLPKHSLT